ncbi:hypothetical protein EV359DRAFT_69191, partial [Lentinula novae-zelandiae]
CADFDGNHAAHLQNMDVRQSKDTGWRALSSTESTPSSIDQPLGVLSQLDSTMHLGVACGPCPCRVLITPLTHSPRSKDLCMPNVVDRHPSVTFGKRKRSSKKDRQEHTAATRLARQFMLDPNQSPPKNTSDADDDKENDGFNRPGPSDASQKQKNRADDLKKERDERIEVLEQESRRQKIVMEDIEERLQKRLKDYQRQIHALKVKISHIPSRLVTATNRVAHTYNTKADDKQTFFLKDSSGIIPDEARDVFLDLVAMDAVPVNKVTHVFKWIAGESGNASKLQIIEVLKDAKGITLSGDGTTHKNETYESKFATVITPNKKLQFFLSLKMALNHTSETQLEG